MHDASVELYWLPLGAGGHVVRRCGRAYEAVVCRLERRPACDLYHSALEVRVPEGRFVVEQAPAWAANGSARGVVAGGAVGSRLAGRLRLFRYEVRLWRDGVIPDVAEAVESPHRVTDDEAVARRLLELVPAVPTAVWGRDELRAGEMWNSNSIVAWLLARAGLPAGSIRPPAGGRAPGWQAGVVVARRDPATAATSREDGDERVELRPRTASAPARAGRGGRRGRPRRSGGRAPRRGSPPAA